MSHICIICAIKEERKAILSAIPDMKYIPFQKLKTWRFIDICRQITLIESGIGIEKAVSASKSVLAFYPDIIINAGFCGALTSDVRTGDCFLAESLQTYSNGRLSDPFKSDRATFSGLRDNFRLARFITLEKITNKDELVPKLDLSILTHVIEMESSAIANICSTNNIGFAAIRTVSDTLDNDPADIFRLITDEEMNISPVKIAATILKNPTSTIKLATMAKDVKLAERSLTKAVSIALELV